MLPADSRMRRRQDFTRAVRRGRRARRPLLVVHVQRCAEAGAPALVGFAVGRAVGGAVVRNRVRRRLRHLTRCHLGR
ncbi:MAG: ribonuclease P protein component, partial [Streptosporangiaceae bacterium]